MKKIAFIIVFILACIYVVATPLLYAATSNPQYPDQLVVEAPNIPNAWALDYNVDCVLMDNGVPVAAPSKAYPGKLYFGNTVFVSMTEKTGELAILYYKSLVYLQSKADQDDYLKCLNP